MTSFDEADLAMKLFESAKANHKRADMATTLAEMNEHVYADLGLAAKNFAQATLAQLQAYMTLTKGRR